MDKRSFTELAQLFPGSPNFAGQVQRLSASYAAWRDVPADGNCFYRSIAFGLLEYLLSPAAPYEELELLFKRIRWQEMPIPDDRVADYMTVLTVLFELLQKKHEGYADFSEQLMHFMQDSDFMKSFINVLRNLSYQSLLLFKPEGIYYAGCEEDMRENLRFGQQSGEADMLGLSSALDISITQVTMGSSDFQETLTRFPSKRRAAQAGITVHTGLIGGHFYAFYPNQTPV